MFEELFLQSGLSLERLHALVRLSESGSLIAAAGGDPGLQSRYSHYLRELSAYFGVELTMRVGKTIRLTEAGERLVQVAREQFQALTRVKVELADVVPSYRIGANDSLLQWLVIPGLAAQRSPSQPCRFSLHTLSTNDVISQLQEMRVDVGIVRKEALPRGMKSRPLCTVHHVVVVPDRLVARRGMLTLKQALLGCPHVCMAQDVELRRSIERVAEGFGGTFQPEILCDSVSQCVAAVRTGTFAALMPEWAWSPDIEMPHTVVEDSALESLDRELMLAWHPRFEEVHGEGGRKCIASLADALRGE